MNLDPSQMDPRVLMELSQLVQQLPPEKLNQMQSLMHNMMAGIDVRREMEEFEKSLPAGFREKMTALMASAPIATQPTSVPAGEMNLSNARITILKAVAAGKLSPEQAEPLLFPPEA